MPFDFDLAMDVLEKLTPIERSAVLQALNLLAAPIGVKGRDEHVVYAVWCQGIISSMNLKPVIGELEQTVEIQGFHGLSATAPQLTRRNLVDVSFRVPADQILGLAIHPHGVVPAGQEKEMSRQTLAIEQLVEMRKERDIL